MPTRFRASFCVLAAILMAITFGWARGRSSTGRSHSYSHARSSTYHSYSRHSTGTRSTRFYAGRTNYGVSRSRSTHSSAIHTPRTGRSTATYVTRRDSHGKVVRSQAAKDAFKRSHPCPANGHTRGACPGYVIDHVRPLAKGGPDDPSNMQWQTTAAAKAKDKVERR